MSRPRPSAGAARPSIRVAHVEGEGLTWVAIGTAASFFLGVLLEPFRARIGLENVVVSYLAIVVVCAAIGGRAAGVWTVLSVALAYIYFFTTPYRTLHVDSLEQVVTVLLLSVAGLLAASMGRWARRMIAREHQEADAIRLLNELAYIVASGGDPDRLAARGVLDLLDARRVQVRRGNAITADAGEPDSEPDTTTMAQLGAKGHLAPERLGGRVRRVRMGLPREGAVVVLKRAGRDVGALVIVPGPEPGVSTTVRVALAGIAHTLAMAGPGSLPLTNGQLRSGGDGP